MTPAEIEHVYDVWSRMQRSSSFQKVLTKMAEQK
jgi:hypothetical protein